MVSFILELVVWWQDLDFWLKFRVKKKSGSQDLGVRILTALINRGLFARIWKTSFADNQVGFTYFFSLGPLSVCFIHNFTRLRSGWTKELFSYLLVHLNIVSNSVQTKKKVI